MAGAGVIKGRLFKTERRALKHVKENGAADWQTLYDVSGSSGHPGHFLDRPVAEGYLKKIGEKYDITPEGRKFVDRYCGSINI